MLRQLDPYDWDFFSPFVGKWMWAIGIHWWLDLNHWICVRVEFMILTIRTNWTFSTTAVVCIYGQIQRFVCWKVKCSMEPNKCLVIVIVLIIAFARTVSGRVERHFVGCVPLNARRSGLDKNHFGRNFTSHRLFMWAIIFFQFNKQTPISMQTQWNSNPNWAEKSFYFSFAENSFHIGIV